MQSLKTRFNGKSEEVTQYAHQFGVLPAMEHYQVKDFMAMERFLKEVAPGDTFQIHKCEVTSYSRPDAFDQLLEAMLQKFLAMETKISVLGAQNNELKKQVEYYKALRWNEARPIVQAVFDYCEAKNES